jgi:hypothetical protein
VRSRHESAGEGGVYVADDEHPVGFFVDEDGFEALHDGGGLGGV